MAVGRGLAYLGSQSCSTGGTVLSVWKGGHLELESHTLLCHHPGHSCALTVRGGHGPCSLQRGQALPQPLVHVANLSGTCSVPGTALGTGIAVNTVGENGPPGAQSAEWVPDSSQVDTGPGTTELSPEPSALLGM